MTDDARRERLDELADTHHIGWSRSMCRCGWEGDNFAAHVRDMTIAAMDEPDDPPMVEKVAAALHGREWTVERPDDQCQWLARTALRTVAEGAVERLGEYIEARDYNFQESMRLLELTAVALGITLEELTELRGRS